LQLRKKTIVGQRFVMRLYLFLKIYHTQVYILHETTLLKYIILNKKSLRVTELTYYNQPTKKKKLKYNLRVPEFTNDVIIKLYVEFLEVYAIEICTEIKLKITKIFIITSFYFCFKKY